MNSDIFFFFSLSVLNSDVVKENTADNTAEIPTALNPSLIENPDIFMYSSLFSSLMSMISSSLPLIASLAQFS